MCRRVCALVGKQRVHKCKAPSPSPVPGAGSPGSSGHCSEGWGRDDTTSSFLITSPATANSPCGELMGISKDAANRTARRANLNA